MGDTAKASRMRWGQLIVLTLAVLLVAIDGTVLNLAIPEFTRDLQPTSTELLWILDVYSLVLAGLLVTAGTISDRFGRKRVLLIGSTVFAGASVLAAFSVTPAMLIGARVLMAFGGAAIMPSTLALIRNIFTDDRERRVAIGVWSAMAGAGAALGPIVGGALLEHFPWGAVFLINVPVLAVLLVAGVFLLPEFKDPHPGRLDLLSVGLSIVGLIGVVYSIKSLAHDGITVVNAVTTVIGVLALWLFVRRQRRLEHPLIDVSLFQRRPFTGSVFGNLLALIALAGTLLSVSQLLQLVDGFSPLEAGIRLVPMTLGLLVVAFFTARLLNRFGTRAVVCAGLVIGALAMLLFANVAAGSYPFVAIALFLLGAGVGMALTATSDAIVAAAPPEKAGAASSISETAYELGTGIGIASIGTLLTVSYAALLPATGNAAVDREARESLAGALEAAPRLPAAEAVQFAEHAKTAFVTALEQSSIVSAGFLLAAALAVVLLLRPDKRLPQPAAAQEDSA